MALSTKLHRKVLVTTALAIAVITALSMFDRVTLDGSAAAFTRTGTGGGNEENRNALTKKTVQLAAASVESGVAITIENGVSEATVRTAMRLVRLDLTTIFSGWTLEFKAPRTGYLGLTLVKQRRVEIYLRAGRSAEGIAHDLAHELGHVADVTYNNNEDRNTYLSNRGLAETTPWWTCNSCGDLQVGAGDFAETFAVLVGPKFKFYSEVGPKPTATQAEAIIYGFNAELGAAVRAGARAAA